MNVAVRHILRKMRVELTDPVTYWLRLGDQEIQLNDYLGQSLRLEFTGHIFCVQCGRSTKKSFQQGHCFPCMRRINECDNCVLHPERCHVEEGTCPQDDWAHTQCYQRHVVYLANSTGLKVGITRHNHIPSRWIDQGAGCALPIFNVKNRRQVGRVEVAFKKYVNDKTNWRAMLKNEVTAIDLSAERERLMTAVTTELAIVVDDYADGVIEYLPTAQSVTINYPVVHYPSKITALNFEKTPVISGQLHGIKGQYLIFDCGVLNIRKFSGYEVNAQFS